MIGAGSNDRSFARAVIDTMPKETEVQNLEKDYEDAKDGAFEELIDAIHAKDIKKLKESFKAIMAICREEDEEPELEEIPE